MSAGLPLMSHFIPYFPDQKTSDKIARTMADEGAEILEAQFPYSDPTADGPVIQSACGIALKEGFTVSGGFDFLKRISRGTASKIFLMTYAGLVYNRGVEQFVREARESGVSGIIVPDLPVDQDEGLFPLAKKAGIEPIPVLSPSMEKERIDTVMELSGKYVYATLRAGITGTKTQIGEGNVEFLENLKEYGKTVLAGFGITDRNLAEKVASHADIVVAGSVFMKPFLKSTDEGMKRLSIKLKEIIRGD
jgi:tryptophan synthase alpha chain